MFFILVCVIFGQYSKYCSKNIRDADMTISGSMSTMSPKTSTCEVLSDVLRKLRANFVYNNGVRDKFTACLMVKLRSRLGRVTEKSLAHCTAC